MFYFTCNHGLSGVTINQWNCEWATMAAVRKQKRLPNWRNTTIIRVPRLRVRHEYLRCKYKYQYEYVDLHEYKFVLKLYSSTSTLHKYQVLHVHLCSKPFRFHAILLQLSSHCSYFLSVNAGLIHRQIESHTKRFWHFTCSYLHG